MLTWQRTSETYDTVEKCQKAKKLIKCTSHSEVKSSSDGRDLNVINFFSLPYAEQHQVTRDVNNVKFATINKRTHVE
jgi:hypothetical protein